MVEEQRPDRPEVVLGELALLVRLLGVPQGVGRVARAGGVGGVAESLSATAAANDATVAIT